jgi:hypothetical protein
VKGLEISGGYDMTPGGRRSNMEGIYDGNTFNMEESLKDKLS